MSKTVDNCPGCFNGEFCIRNGCVGIIQCNEESVCYCTICGWDADNE